MQSLSSSGMTGEAGAPGRDGQKGKIISCFNVLVSVKLKLFSNVCVSRGNMATTYTVDSVL